jgi:hypothetical protein
MEPSPGVGLGRPVERSLQFSDLVLLGGPSHKWHSPALPCTSRMNEAAPFHHRRFCCPVSSSGTYGRLRRPPGPRSTSRLNTGYRTRRSGSTNAAGCRAGEGLPSSRRHHLNVPRPLRRGVPRGCTPGSSPLPWPSP